MKVTEAKTSFIKRIRVLSNFIAKFVNCRRIIRLQSAF